MTKFLHIEHPEDSILNGNLSVINWFLSPGNLSVKIDGSPAICWGTNPITGRFCVGTKSVFNNIKVKIAHSHEEIDQFYNGKVADILHLCFDYLPYTDGFYQGDWIGEGGQSEYTPNTITYQFPENVTQKIIVAPHTFYKTSTTLQDAIAVPDCSNWTDTEEVKYVKPDAYVLHDPWSKEGNPVCFDDVEEVCKFALQMSKMVEFANGNKLIEIKKQINSCIRSGVKIEPEDFDCDPNLISFWKLIQSIKEDCLYLCRNNGPSAYIGNQRVDAEGYVFTNEFGSYKLINRACFSHHNFNSGRFQKCHNVSTTET